MITLDAISAELWVLVSTAENRKFSLTRLTLGFWHTMAIHGTTFERLGLLR